MTQVKSDLAVEQAIPSHKPQTLWQRVALAGNSMPVWGWCLLLFAIAMSFNLYRLGNPSIWYDEAFSVELARQQQLLLWHIIFGAEPNMELYYLFLHFWLGFTALLGLHPIEAVVRFPSAIFAALSTVVLFLLGKRFLGLLPALVGATLYLLNDVQLVYAQQTRSYSMQLLLICLAWYALFAALTVSNRSSQRRWWACFVIATALAIYAHLFSMLILFAQICALAVLLLLPNAWRTALRQRFWALLLSLAATFVLIIPMLLVSLHGPKTSWLPVPHLHDLYHLFETISGGSKSFLAVTVAACAISLALLLFAYLRPHASLLQQVVRDDAEPGATTMAGEAGTEISTQATKAATSSLQQIIPVAFALVCWVVVPVVVSYVVSQGSTRLFSARYLVVIVPPLCLLMALGVSLLRWRVVQVLLIAVLLLSALAVVPTYYKSAQVEDWNSTTFWLEQHYQPGDGLVCYDNALEQGCQISVQYYLDAYPSAAHFTSDMPGAFSWQNLGPANPASGPEAAVDPTALAAFGAHHSRIFYIQGRFPDAASAARAQAAQRWLDSHYHLIAQIVTRTVTIRLYMTQ